jgi:NAD-dependent SIR2 family protein deacetylase
MMACMSEPSICASSSALRPFLKHHPRLFVLTGAGISTESGIPAYRDADGRWNRPPPVFVHDFLTSPSVRRHYWARSMRGWAVVSKAPPNVAHVALARLQGMGAVERLVTQNVDGLHQRAGSEDVIELHGNLLTVVCLECGASYSRQSIQRQMEVDNPEEMDNPDYRVPTAHVGPDGHAEADGELSQRFRMPQCARCEGMLKPSVVFFGEGVPRDRVELARAALHCADALLVVGSSLKVYSGYRFCEWAHAMGKPIAAVNRGTTRADHLLALKVEQSCSAALCDALDA